MTGSIDLTPDGHHLLIRFPYRADLVQEVRAIPGRTWDPAARIWRVPAREVEHVVRTFARHGFELSAEVSELLDEPPREAAPDPSPRAWTVSMLNERVRGALLRAFPEPVWVVGEVLDYDKCKGRTHAFFQLVEKARDEPRPRASVSVALFESAARRIKARLSQAERPLELRDGLEIRVLVRVELYAPGGRYQVVVEDLDPEFTLGKMALTREAILAELRARGLYRRNLSLPLPAPPLSVGVLTSLESDGWNDFLQQLRGSGFGFSVTCHPARVQGKELVPTMLAGLRWFAARADRFDVLCILRGGGSRTDLSWFDDKELAFAVARCPIKIVCGIGHHRDRSILDEIAHSEKTPTAAGALLVEAARQSLQELEDRRRRVADLVRRRLTHEHAGLVAAGERLRRVVHGRVAATGAGLEEAVRRLGRAARQALVAFGTLQRERRVRLVRGVEDALQAARRMLESCEQRQRLLDPRRVLARGYALVQDAHGHFVKSVADLAPGDRIGIALRDGVSRARVEEVEEIEPREDP